MQSVDCHDFASYRAWESSLPSLHLDHVGALNVLVSKLSKHLLEQTRFLQWTKLLVFQKTTKGPSTLLSFVLAETLWRSLPGASQGHQVTLDNAFRYLGWVRLILSWAGEEALLFLSPFWTCDLWLQTEHAQKSAGSSLCFSTGAWISSWSKTWAYANTPLCAHREGVSIIATWRAPLVVELTACTVS